MLVSAGGGLRLASTALGSLGIASVAFSMAAAPEPLERGLRAVVVERGRWIRIFVFGREQLFERAEPADVPAGIVVKPEVLLTVRLHLQGDAIVVVLDVLGDAAQRIDDVRQRAVGVVLVVPLAPGRIGERRLGALVTASPPSRPSSPYDLMQRPDLRS